MHCILYIFCAPIYIVMIFIIAGYISILYRKWTFWTVSQNPNPKNTQKTKQAFSQASHKHTLVVLLT